MGPERAKNKRRRWRQFALKSPSLPGTLLPGTLLPGTRKPMLFTTVLNALLHFGSVVLLAVGALLPIVDPLGGAPIYLAMTASLTHEERGRMAKAVAIYSFLLLIASALIGAYVLDFFGLSIPAVQVAGGIVVCAIGWSLLNSPNSPPALQRNSPSATQAAPASPDDLNQR